MGVKRCLICDMPLKDHDQDFCNAIREKINQNLEKERKGPAK